jgi:HK97 family phage major capsid protein
MPATATNKTQEIRDRLEELIQIRQTVVSKADEEGREFTAEEQRLIDENKAEFAALNADLSRRLDLEEDIEALRQPQARKTAPEPVQGPEEDEDEGDEDEEPARRPAAPRMSGRPAAYREPARARRTAAGQWGWDSFGHFARAVRMAAVNGGHIDTRLSVRMAPTEYANEGTGADGGFAVPPDFRTEIMEKVMGEDSLLGRTDDYVTTGNTFTAPIDATTPWGTTGIQAYWTGEGALKTQSKPALESVTVKLNKIAALCPVTDELLEDAPALDRYLRRKVPQIFNYKINYALLRGTGVGQPQGIINSGAVVSVAKESGQTADTINFENIRKMWSRLTADSRRNAVWVTSQDAEAVLSTLTFTPSGGTSIPVFMPAGGISGAGYSTLYGRPIITSEAIAGLGDQGDILLADFSKYLSVRKTSGPRTDVSIHLWFDYDITAYRFVFRVGGQPWWDAPVTSATGTTRSPFVVLDERA